MDEARRSAIASALGVGVGVDGSLPEPGETVSTVDKVPTVGCSGGGALPIVLIWDCVAAEAVVPAVVVAVTAVSVAAALACVEIITGGGA